MMTKKLFKSRYCAGAMVSTLTWASPGSVASSKTLIDGIAATVDGKIVLHSEVQRKVVRGPLVQVSAYPANESETEETKALHDAINYLLVMNKTEELGMTVEDSAVERRIDEILRQQGISSREHLEKMLAEEGTTLEYFKNKIRDQMLLMRWQGREILPRVKTRREPEVTVEAVQLKQLLVKFSDDKAPEARESKAQIVKQAHEKLTTGVLGFDEAVKIYSEGTNRDEGGLMDALPLTDLSGDIRPHVEKLGKGEFTEPIESPIGFHIFYLVDKTFTKNETFAADREEIKNRQRAKEIQSQIQVWLRQARHKAKIVIVQKD